jgi:DNA-binding beta-propeller fold protein YncE
MTTDRTACVAVLLLLTTTCLAAFPVGNSSLPAGLPPSVPRAETPLGPTAPTSLDVRSPLTADSERPVKDQGLFGSDPQTLRARIQGAGYSGSTAFSTTSVGVPGNPEYAVYDNADGEVYVGGELTHDISVINGSSVVASIVLDSGLGSLGPSSLVYDDATGCVYALNEGSANVTIIRGSAIVGVVSAGPTPGAVVYDSFNHYVYVVNENIGPGGGNGSVSVFDNTTLLGTVDVGVFPWTATVDTANGYVYVTNPDSKNVSVINGTKLVGTVSVPSGAYGAAFDTGTGNVYVSSVAGRNSSQVGVINGTTLIGNITVGPDAGFITYDGRTGLVYVAIGDGPSGPTHNVSIIKGTTVLATITAGFQPESMVYDQENGLIYVSSSAYIGNGTVSILNGTAAIANVSVGVEPGYEAVSSGNGQVYVPNKGSGNVSIISEAYPVTFSESGLPPGTEWWVNVSGGASNHSVTNSLSIEEGYGQYDYTTAAANDSYSGSGGSFSVNDSGISEAVSFIEVPFAVIFQETGLPSGTNWSVTIGANTGNSTTSSISIPVYDGTYTYALGRVDGYSTSNFSGVVTVSGHAIVRSVTWRQLTYPVDFVESGLPTGTSWAVNLGLTGEASHAIRSTGTMISTTVPNGTYSYSVAVVPGWNTSIYSGTFVVDGLTVSTTLSWSRVTYTVTFAETGLPSGTTWSVTFNKTVESGTGDITFADYPNGTYAFAIPSFPGYQANPGSGTVSVAGFSLTRSVYFQIHGNPAAGNNGTGQPTFLGLPSIEGYALIGIVAAVVVVGIAVVALQGRGGRNPPSGGAPPSETEGEENAPTG